MKCVDNVVLLIREMRCQYSVCVAFVSVEYVSPQLLRC